MMNKELEELKRDYNKLKTEFEEFKQHIGRDKHELIKSNIALNKKVQELKYENTMLNDVKKLETLLRNQNYWKTKEMKSLLQEKINKLEQQIQRYKEMLDIIIDHTDNPEAIKEICFSEVINNE